ncbi:alpha/beta fold hydrolase [Pseudomonas sp. FEN]|uniref:alpha/beta fold hydrolase n=1 Tax=Pseudomonas sp. FEN TaxID=2767468 RepID=UPI001748636C|nr:alpha/beta hydrolase [Pseudomonas sp. FEN]
MEWIVGIAIFAAVNAALWAISSRIDRYIEAKVPPEGRFIEVGGERIHYQDEGSGPALVMIHGLTGCGRNLTYALSPCLREQFRVITLDRPGSGYSSRSPGARVDIPAQAGLIAEFIRTLDLDRPLVLGHSLGGALALSLALDHPQLVCGLVLVAPLTHPQRVLPLMFLSLWVRPAWLRGWLARTLSVPLGMLGRKGLIKAVFAPEPPPEDFAERGGGLLGLRSNNFYCASSEVATMNNDLPEMVRRYPQLTLPVGLIYGSGDRVLSYRKHGESMLGKLPGLRLEIIEGAGHMLPVTAAEPVADLVRDIARQAKPRHHLAFAPATAVLGPS